MRRLLQLGLGTAACVGLASAVGPTKVNCTSVSTEPSSDKGTNVFTAPTLSERLYFLVDDFLSTSARPRLFLLGASTGVLLLLGSVSFFYVGGAKSGGEAVWKAWTVIADPGTHTLIRQGPQRSVGVVFTLGGLFFFALLITLVNDTISSYLDELQSGHSRVLIDDHVVVLGWSNKLPSILTEFAKDPTGVTTYVVLCDKPKDEIDALLADLQLEQWGGHKRVIVRVGDPCNVSDLLRVSPNTASSIVLLSPECDDDNEADALVLASAMGLLSLHVHAPIVVEIRDKDNLSVVHQVMQHDLTKLGQGQVVPVAGDDIVGNVLIQASFQPGMAKVLHHLLDYAEGQGNEVYMQCCEAVTGRTFGEVAFLFDNAVPVGVRSARLTASSGCGMLLNPHDSFVLEPGDEIVAIAKDLHSFSPRSQPAPHQFNTIQLQDNPRESPKLFDQRRDKYKILICNWRDDIEDVIWELDKWVGPGSELTVLSHFSAEQRKELLEAGGGLRKLHNIRVNHLVGHTVKKRHLEKVLSSRFDAIIVSSNDIQRNTSTADARAIVCSLLVQDILADKERRSAPQHTSVITEIKDRRSLQVLRVAGVTNFVIANELASMLMVHLSRNPSLSSFWIDNIFSAQGVNLNIESVAEHFLSKHQHQIRLSDLDTTNQISLSDLDTDQHPLARLSFWDLLALCRAQGTTPIGFKRQRDRTWTFNPIDKTVPLDLQQDDHLIVLQRSVANGHHLQPRSIRSPVLRQSLSDLITTLDTLERGVCPP